MTAKGYVKGLKYLIDDAITYYRISKVKSYAGVMHRINMGCEIYPREKDFWQWEADKTISVIDKYVYEMTIYDANEARLTADSVRERLQSIDISCDPYRWYESRLNKDDSKNDGKPKNKEPEWNAEDYVVGMDHLTVLG